jgi:hypothetical protein
MSHIDEILGSELPDEELTEELTDPMIDAILADFLDNE